MITPTHYKDTKVALFGLGRTGLAAGRALVAGGAQVLAWDDGDAARENAAQKHIPLIDLYAADWSGLTAFILSPGVPLHFPKPHQLVVKARAGNVPIIGDTELFIQALSESSAKTCLIVITGTNGKSTTTALIGHILCAAGRKVSVGGNIGVSVLDLEAPEDGRIYVVEMSSYQLDLTPSLSPDVAILLNLSPDHLDRHGSMANYVAAKAQIFANQTKTQTAILSVDDQYCRDIAQSLDDATGRNLLKISTQSPIVKGFSVQENWLVEGGDKICDLTQLPTLPGRHNWQNATAAFAACRALGVSTADIISGLKTFPGLAHRMEQAGMIAGIRFVNDSKATNADAAGHALASYDNIYWIAGGQSKQGGISALAPLFPHLAHAFLIGEAAHEFAGELGGIPHTISGDIETAITQAFDLARKQARDNPVVLLSPACASFDQFKDFEIRGEAFKQCVANLEKAGKANR